MKRNALIKMVQFSILLALEVILCFTPLGSIPIGPMVATLAMIPVILTGILLGVGAGAAMGFFAGLFSFIVWTFISPGPTAFVFTPFVSIGDIHGNGWSLVICFIPRILTGVVAAVSAKGFAKLLHYKFSIFTYSLSGILASLTNTFLVLGGIYLFFGQSYASALGIAYEALLGAIGLTILTNGIPEAVVAAITSYAIAYPIRKYVMKDPNLRQIKEKK